MVKFQLHIRMSEYLGYCVDSISKKLNLSYNAIVMSALNDYVKRHLTEEEQAEILRWIENKNQELVIIEEPEDREWKKHRATMSDAKKPTSKDYKSQKKTLSSIPNGPNTST
jgi:predicted transcriptional regulator